MVSDWKRRVLVALIALLPFGAAARAESIEGMYRVEGNAPGADQAYRGKGSGQEDRRDLHHRVADR
jgi:hypothetical protein